MKALGTLRRHSFPCSLSLMLNVCIDKGRLQWFIGTKKVILLSGQLANGLGLLNVSFGLCLPLWYFFTSQCIPMSLHGILFNALVKVLCSFFLIFGLIYFIVSSQCKIYHISTLLFIFVFALSLLMHIFKQPHEPFLFDAYVKAAAEFSTDFETPCHIIMAMILRTSCG